MSNQIATVIRDQILAGGRMKVMSWGANNWTAGENFLKFKVQGHHFKGYVKVTLTSMDDYTIQFISTHGNIKKEINGMFFDQLTEVIDNYVEYIPSYKNN